MTTDPVTLLKYFVTAPVITELAKETESMNDWYDTDSEIKVRHHRDSKTQLRKEEDWIKKLTSVLTDNNAFSSEPIDSTLTINYRLRKIMSNEILDEKLTSLILGSDERAMSRIDIFIKERINAATINLWDRLTCPKFPKWDSTLPEVTVKTADGYKTVRLTNALFRKIIIASRSSRDDIDLEKLIGNHEISDRIL
ncbi:hypothetical protein SNE40_018191 [Patella caerulea]|uniref:Uncharacterized protein n=1 Tax=Patella caerulea TaxID=87958 RepID=A0AAN8JA79_PATCE